jgi:DNA polymerase/3'-5' exonuclease PolX
MDRDQKLSEYGLRDRETDEMIAGATEQDVYKALDLETPIPAHRTGDLSPFETG